MSWRQQVFGPMRERTVENAQVRLLANRYDLSRDSRLAREIVRHVNEALDREERDRQVRRVRPGELLLHTARGELTLPIRTEEDLDRAIGGEGLRSIRRDILDRCLNRYRDLFPDATPRRLESLLRALQAGYGARRSPNPGHGINLSRRDRCLDPATGDAVNDLKAAAERGVACKPTQSPHPAHRAQTLAALGHFLGEQAGVPPAVREPMLLDLARLRALFCPRISTCCVARPTAELVAR